MPDPLDLLTVDLADAMREPGESGDGADEREVAASLLESGWRPPARVIATAEELDALPVGTVVVSIAPSGTATPWQLLDFLGAKGGRLWTAPFLRDRYNSHGLLNRFKRVVVLWEPGVNRG
ncbi:hypothetical protein [Nocardia sp. NPDC059239]|uniref:hypothetical protein n=1 Tax=unclassified Nocardia TaxID=2637762 RepID=UPI0036BC0221